MALIKIELDYPLEDGMSLTFKAPCDCTAVTGVKVYYPQITEDTSTTVSKSFSFRDAHLNALTSLGDLFVTGATVKIVVDTVNNYAFIQNADTNAYIESKIDGLTAEDVGAAVAGHTHTAANVKAGTFAGQVKANTNAVAAHGTSQVRNIYATQTDLTAGTSGLVSGNICLVYE